jgi:pimeloyl-ACP methyl ester carboxylesterase
MTQKLNIPSGQIAFTENGQGRAVVFVHGLCETKSIWNNITAGLQDHYHVLAFDAMGFGDSVPAEGFDFSMRAQALAILQALGEKGITEATWIGHSMGGYMSLAAAAMHPEAVNGLLLMHSTAGADSEERKESRNKTIAVIERTPELFIREFYYNLFAPHRKAEFSSEIEEFKTQARKIDPEHLIGTLKGLRDRPSTEEMFRKLDVPKHYIIGKYDQVIPAASLLQQAPDMGAKYTILEDSGHMGFLEEPGKALEAVLSFLKEFKN